MKNTDKIEYVISSAGDRKSVWYNLATGQLDDQSFGGVHKSKVHLEYIKTMYNTFTKHLTYIKYDGNVVTIDEVTQLDKQ